MNLNRLEEYLDEVAAPLARLPVRERDEWRDEARQHLLALVEAHRELGASESEAVEAALARFGEPRQVGRRLLAAATRGTLKGLTDSHRLGYATWALIWNTGVLMAAIRLLLARPEAGGRDWSLLLGPAQLAGATLLVIAGYAAAGATLGWHTGESRSTRGLALGYVGLIGAGLALTGAYTVFTPIAAAAACAVTAGSLAAGSLGAGIAAGLRRRREEPLPPAILG